MAIRVVLAEDHYLVREGVRRLLETQPDFDVVACVTTSTRFSPQSTPSGRTSSSPTYGCRRVSTDEGIQAAERLRETHPEIGVVVLSQYANPSYVLALLERGSGRRAYLLKERVRTRPTRRARSGPSRRADR